LDDAVPVKMKIKRGGVEKSVKVMTRERRFCQYVNSRGVVWFKEFGASRDLNKKTGEWAKPGQRLPAEDRATEILHFTKLPDAHTPYGVPTWINQMPSVLGSRKAEELNLEFFDNGGVPPVLILLQGGVLAGQSRQALNQAVAFGPASRKNRVQVVEMEPVSGTLDNPGNSKITVERFGSDRQQDSMFENYDLRCEVRVRRSFRLPPIFVGQANDYSFATAFASYTVAEAQVFKPERDEFDEVISVKLIPALGFPGYRIKSRPMQIEDATLKLQGIEVAILTQQVDAETIVSEINATVGTTLKINPNLPTILENSLAALGASQGSSGASSGASKTTTGVSEDKIAQKIGATPVGRPRVANRNG
jgi:capsid portal protein